MSVSPDTQDQTSCCVHHRLSHDEAGCTIGGCWCNPTSTNETGPTGSFVTASAFLARREVVNGRATVIDLVDYAAEVARDVHARYEQLAKWADQQADSREHFAKVDPTYRMTLIPYRAMAERIRMVAGR